MSNSNLSTNTVRSNSGPWAPPGMDKGVLAPFPENIEEFFAANVV